MPLRGVAVAALALVLGGCATLPMTGPVETASPQIPARYSLDVLAEGPQEDASAEEIVDGFLRASAYGFTDDFAVARSYLAPEIAASWNPAARVHIYSGDQNPAITTAEDGGITVTIEETAGVDDGGRYTAVEASPLTTGFSLVRDAAGQWRIASLDDGVLISDLNFEQTFSASPLQFFTADYSATVPDVRWYPFDDRASAIVRGLLGGPSGWLAASVATAFPEGTRLGARGVTIEDGLATVDLSAHALSASDGERALMAAQLSRSLSVLTTVTSVALTVEGDEFPAGEAQGLGLPQSVASAVMLSDGALVRWNGRELIPVAGAADLSALEPSHPAVPFADSEAPMVMLAGANQLVTVPTPEQPSALLWDGPNLVAPSIDRYGWVWTSTRANTGSLVAVTADRAVATVSAPWLAGREVLQVRVAGEGARVVVVSRGGGQTRIELAAVSRDRNGMPVALGEPLRIGDALSVVSDVTWVDQYTVAVLGATISDSGARPHLLPIGGPASVLETVEDAVAITSSRNVRSMMLATADGRLYVREGISWRAVAESVSDPAFSG